MTGLEPRGKAVKRYTVSGDRVLNLIDTILELTMQAELLLKLQGNLLVLPGRRSLLNLAGHFATVAGRRIRSGRQRQLTTCLNPWEIPQAMPPLSSDVLA